MGKFSVAFVISFFLSFLFNFTLLLSQENVILQMLTLRTFASVFNASLSFSKSMIFMEF